MNYPDANIRLIEGSGGIFDVTCNSRRVYSKLNSKEDRFPQEGEISRLVGQERGRV